MRLRSASELVDDLRKVTDTEYATDRFPNAEMLEYLNQSIVRLYTRLDQMDHTYFQDSKVFNTVNGQVAYGLPSDFWVLKGVTISPSGVSGGNDIRLRKYQPSQTAALNNSQAYSAYNYPCYYRLKGDQLLIRPAPNGVFPVTLDYTPTPQRLTLTPESYFDGMMGFERWVVLDAGIKVKTKDSLDPAQIMAEKADVEAWIQSVASSRDVGEPETIQDMQTQDLLSDIW